MSCKECGSYELKKMVNSGKPFGYSGEIPCLNCKRYEEKEDNYTPKTPEPVKES